MKNEFAELNIEISRIINDSTNLMSKINPSYPNDVLIQKSLLPLRKQLEELVSLIDLQNPIEELQKDFVQHKLDEKKILSANNWQDSAVPSEISKWRRNPRRYPYNEITLHQRKEVFDYYFRNDLYGELNDNSIIRLGRGVLEPDYFIPPAIIKIAIDTASKNNWFGYSDSLGHIDTRNAIAILEKNRRGNNIETLSSNNTAVVQGGTIGLHSVLSMISQMNPKKNNCVAAIPTYAPIIDDASHHFKLDLINLSQNYQVDYDQLTKLAAKKETGVVLLSIPHNPYGFRELKEHLNKLHSICQKNDVYLVLDEIVYDPTISPYLNPVDYPNLIVISSYSKKYNIPGLKLGHLLANESFIQKFYRHASTTYGSPPSFLYLTATCINLMELITDIGRPFDASILPEYIKDGTSDPELIVKSYKIWQDFCSVHKKFQHIILDTFHKHIGHIGIEKIIGLDDPSPNVVFRIKNKGDAYTDSLKILARTNVSVMPIECFIPPNDWPRDLRVTITNNPKNLITGLTRLVHSIDEIYARETKNQWLYSDDVLWLEKLGVFEFSKNDIGWGRTYRVCQRLEEIYKFSVGKPASENIYRTASLSSIPLIWKKMLPHQRKEQYERITGAKFSGNIQNHQEVLANLFEQLDKSSELPKLPQKIKDNLLALCQEPSFTRKPDDLLFTISTADSLQWLKLDSSSPQELQDRFHELGQSSKYYLLMETSKKLNSLIKGQQINNQTQGNLNIDRTKRKYEEARNERI